MFRLLIGGILVLVLGLSFLTTRVVDDLAPAGSTDVITVWDQSTAASDSFQTLVEETARAHDMTVLKEVRSESGAAVIRRQYMANPDAVRAFQLSDHDTSGFDPTLVTRFLPLRDLPSNRVNGMYLTDAGTDAANRFAASLGDAGVTVTVNPLGLVAVALWTVSEVPAVPLGAALLLVIVVGVTSWQAGRRNITAIAATSGRSRGSSSLRDAGGLAAATAIGGGVGVLLMVPVLLLVNDGARLSLFLAVSIAGFIWAMLATMAVALIAAACAHRSLTRSIDGARPWRSVVTVALVCNGLVLALTSSAATAGWQVVTLARHDAAERDLWRPSLSDARLSFSTSDADLDAAEPELAELFTQLDRTGDVVFADHVDAPDPGSHAPDEGNVLLVNAQYLHEQRVQAASGGRVTPDVLDATALTLLVPEGVRVSEEDRRAWRDFLQFQRSLSTNPGSIPAHIEIATLPTSTHRVFNYATDDLWSTSTESNTVIAVLPSGTPSVSANLIVSNMTSGEVVFTDPAVLRSFLTDHRLTVAEIEPLRDAVSYRTAVIERRLRHQLATLGVLALVLGVSAAVTCHAVVMSRRRRITIVRIHGGTSARASGSTLVLPLVVLTLVGTPIVATATGPDQLIALACVAVDLCILLVATTFSALRSTRPHVRHS